MKILKIEFENINSLKGYHEIDFTKAPFTASSLFAITGPTGSGKSTILDVISLALFNQVPRLGKISKNEIANKGAILTRNQKEARAAVTYEGKKGRYRSEWSISTARTGNLREYEMQLSRAETGELIDLKKSEVPAKNEELIGLNYDQFIKSVLLAQGEFAQFLRAKKDERGELLEKITGTGVYRQVGIRAFQKFKEVNSEIEDQQKEVFLLRKDLLEEGFFATLKTQLAEKDEACAPLKKHIAQLEQNIQLKKNIEEQVQQIEAQKKKKEISENSWKKFQEENGLPLEQHEQVQPFAEDLRTWKSLAENRKELEKELLGNLQKEEQNKKGISECLENIRKFIKRDAEAENIEEELQDFSENVRQLQQKRDEKLSSYKSLQKQFDTEVREVPFQLNGNIDSGEEKLQEMFGISQAQIQKIANSLPQIDLEKHEAEKQRLRQELEKVRKAQQQSVKIENLSAKISSLQNEQKAIDPRIKELPKEIEVNEAKVAVQQERLEKLHLKRQNQLLEASLEQHRQHLNDGEPCPLCGSLDHPFIKGLPQQEDGLQEEIVGTQKLLDKLKEQVSTDKATFEHFKKRIDELKKNELEIQKELTTQKGHFEKEFSSLAKPDNIDWEETCAKYDRQISLLENYERENRRLKAISSGLPLLKELKDVLAQGKEIKEELDSLYSGKNINTDCLDLQSLWTGFQHTRKHIAAEAKELQTRLKNKSEELQRLEKTLLSKVQERGCRTIQDAIQKLLPENTYLNLRKQRESLVSEIEKINAGIKTLEDQLEKLQQNESEKAMEVLASELQENQEKLKSHLNECEELRRRIRNNEELQLRVKEIELGLSEKKKHVRRWEILKELIGDSTGKKFNDFAQDLSLTQLLHLANLRLRDLSDRYRMDKPNNEEDDSLVAIDEHMGGQRRSVKTLSGGETFILSLSMALALSDLASKNVEINSLFIDEGFGTLDPETLDQTLDTLEKLQAESSKTIGIISHVDSLKERIATQIQLKRNGQGYSSLELKG